MVYLAKKRKNTKSTKKKTNGNSDGIKVYKVNGSSKKELARQRRNRNMQTVLVVIIIILAIAAIFSAIRTFAPDLFGKYTLGGELAANVNNVPITMERLNTEYDRLPQEYQYFVTKEQYLSQLINEVLMKQEATKMGLTVTEEEVDERVNQFLEDNNMTQDQLDELLVERKLTKDEFREMVKNQQLVDKLLEEAVNSKVNVTSSLALGYYNDNSDSFKVPELVTAKHILISIAEMSRDEAEVRAEFVFEELDDDNSNFCELVEEYSDDAGSLTKCGQYAFPRGQMVEEFENRAFEQEVGDVSIVETQFGFHIILTTNKTTEQLIPFKDVEEQIILVLEQQQEKTIFSDLIAKLREEADIINYLEVEEEEVVEEEVIEEEPAEEETSDEGSATVAVTIVEEEEEVEELEEELVEELEELEEEVPETIEEVEEVVEEEVVEEEMIEEEPAEEEVEEVEEEPEVMPDLDFAECLTSKGAVLYGAFWDSSTKKQKDAFGATIDDITYVECGVEGDFRAQEVVCSDADILAYPTWVINDVKHMGIMSSDQLSALTGCEK